MRAHKIITVAIAAAALSSAAYAAEKTTNPCNLLSWEDLQAYGATKDTPLSEAGWHEEAPPKELPGSHLYTNMCAITIKSTGGRSSITLSFDSFSGKASEQQVRDWLKASTPAEPPEAGTSLVTLGDTTCETGKYNLPTSQEDGSVADTIEHYIACDRQVGLHHVSLNVHVPDANKATLPSAEQTMALLEKFVGRMQQQSFAIAEKAN